MNRYIDKIFRSASILAAIAFLAGGMNVAQAKMVKKQNLLDLMKHTDSILIGTVKNKTDGFYKGLPYTEITLEVGQTIKGGQGSRYTFRQFGLIKPKSMGDGRVNLMVTPAGWPTYSEGEQVMLFLSKPASETGFQTTAGLTQGKFTIRGNQIANDTGNDALFSGVKINHYPNKRFETPPEPKLRLGQRTSHSLTGMPRWSSGKKWMMCGQFWNSRTWS